MLKLPLPGFVVGAIVRALTQLNSAEVGVAQSCWCGSDLWHGSKQLEINKKKTQTSLWYCGIKTRLTSGFQHAKIGVKNNERHARDKKLKRELHCTPQRSAFWLLKETFWIDLFSGFVVSFFFLSFFFKDVSNSRCIALRDIFTEDIISLVKVCLATSKLH